MGSLPDRKAYSKITLIKIPLFRLLFRISALRPLTFQLAVSDQFSNIAEVSAAPGSVKKQAQVAHFR